MKEEQKINFFDQCVPKDLENYIDTLNKAQLNNLTVNLSKMVRKNYIFIKPKIKTMTKKIK